MTDDHNEAQQMQDAYARRQEHEREGAPTSAGGAGSTATPGNNEAGNDATGAGQAGSGQSPIDPTVNVGGDTEGTV